LVAALVFWRGFRADRGSGLVEQKRKRRGAPPSQAGSMALGALRAQRGELLGIRAHVEHQSVAKV